MFDSWPFEGNSRTSLQTGPAAGMPGCGLGVSPSLGGGEVCDKDNESKGCLADYSGFQPLPAHLWPSLTYGVTGEVLGQIRYDLLFNGLWRFPGMGSRLPPTVIYRGLFWERKCPHTLLLWGRFGSSLKHPRRRRLLFSCTWSSGSAPATSLGPLWIQSQHPLVPDVRPACFKIVTNPAAEMSGERKKRRRGRFMGYLLVCYTMYINGNSILTSLPPTTPLNSAWVWSRKRQWRKELNIIHLWARKITPSPLPSYFAI